MIPQKNPLNMSGVSTDATKCILSDNVTNVDDAVSGMFIQRKFVHSTSVSVAANSNGYVEIDTYSCPTGYMPVGVTYAETGNVNVTIEVFNASTTKATMRVHNTTTSARNAKPELTVTFAKTINIGA